ncbi:MAG: formimidoylglutamate deiminase [Kineosporiaceae bacterium]
MSASAWWCEYAWLPEGPVAGVRVEVDEDGVVSSVHAGALRHDADRVLHGLVLPGLANTHCHAFHRALRGRTHESRGTFWTWRERMYALADRLDPDSYCDLATAVYSEMVLAGVTCVGEFHYLHHGPGGARYGDPNAMGEALREAARRAGLRLTLLDTCYFTAGIGVPLEGVQRRFDDSDAEGWAMRVSALRDDERFRVGAAIHSVRAVPADQLEDIVDACRTGDGETDRRPLHVHISEFQAENAACLTAYGMTPTRLLAEHGVLGPTTTAVHATHVTPEDVQLLGATGTTACLCPTTARDLGTGIGPARRLALAGAPVTVGSDQHAVIDLLEEMRMLEMTERLAAQSRGVFDVGQLVAAVTVDGHAALGWPEAGRIAVGAPADLVCLRLDSVRTAGSLPEQAVMTAASADIDTVVVGGREVVTDGVHRSLGPIGPHLSAAIERAWRGGPPARG